MTRQESRGLTKVTFTATSKSSLVNKMHVHTCELYNMYGVSVPFPQFSNLTNQMSRKTANGYRSNFECTLGTAEGQKIWICTLVIDFLFLFLFDLSLIHLHHLEISSVASSIGNADESNYRQKLGTSAPPLPPVLLTC